MDLHIQRGILGDSYQFLPCLRPILSNKRATSMAQYCSIGTELGHSKSDQEAMNGFPLVLRYASKISIVIHFIVLVLESF